MDTRLIAYDYETYWDSTGYTLSKLSPVAYITDRRFYPQLLGVCVNYGDVVVYEHDDIPHALKELELDRPGTMVVAHNGNGFDHLITAFKYGVHPWMMLDTITMMRWCGYSRVMRESHQALTDALGHGIKQAGTVVSDGKRTKNDFTASEWAFFKQYCADDTLQCAMNTLSMLPKVPMDALLFSHLTACMATKPAFVLDEKMLAEHLADLDAKLKQAHADIQSTFAFPDTESMLKAIRSKQRFSDMLRSYGVEPPMKLSVKQSLSCRRGLLNAADLAEKEGNTAEAESLRAKAQDESCYSVYEPALSKTDVDFLALTEHENPHVQALVNLRLQFNSSGHRSRVEKFLQLAKLHRPVSVMLKAYYAHTSRYGAGVSEGASDSLNLQNVSKHNPAMLPLRQSIKAPTGCKVVACDSSQIEARMLAYLSRQEDLLGHFRNNADPYSEMAAKIYNIDAEEIHNGHAAGDKKYKKMRQVGKLLTLSAGYSVGAGKVADTLYRMGIHLSDNKVKHDELSAEALGIYRAANDKIVAFWKQCGNILKHMALGGRGAFGGPHDDLFKYGQYPSDRDGSGLLSKHQRIVLPNGYTLMYPNLHFDIDELTGKQQLCYDQYKGGKPIPSRIWGGFLTENVTQSLAFALLMWQACRMHEAGIQLHANIHDSFASVCPASKADTVASEMKRIMSLTPDWLPGFPVACEVEIGDDFSIV